MPKVKAPERKIFVRSPYGQLITAEELKAMWTDYQRQIGKQNRGGRPPIIVNCPHCRKKGPKTAIAKHAKVCSRNPGREKDAV